MRYQTHLIGSISLNQMNINNKIFNEIIKFKNTGKIKIIKKKIKSLKKNTKNDKKPKIKSF